MDQRRLERLLESLHATDTTGSVLHRICAVSSRTTGSDGAGISRLDDGRHEVIVASDDKAQVIEDLQVDLAEGPCIEAFHTARPFLEPDLTSSEAQVRWPAFAPRALEHGVSAVFAFPLIAAGRPFGAMDMYSLRVGTLDGEQLSNALLLADLAALAARRFDEPADIAEVGLHAEAAEPWAHAAVVHNATGMVSEQLGVDVDEALLRLRAVSFATARRMADVARDVVEHRLRIESWTAHG